MVAARSNHPDGTALPCGVTSDQPVWKCDGFRKGLNPSHGLLLVPARPANKSLAMAWREEQDREMGRHLEAIK